MYFKKKGLPDEGDIVICTVKKILFHSIFATIDEYEALEGMIHISEVAPGRIRNIRDYVKEGKRLVCMVLRVNKEKGQVDLSLRRVPNNLRIQKNEEFKQEAKSEKLLEYIGKQLKMDLATAYKKLGVPLIEHFGLLAIAFNEIATEGKEAISGIKLPAKEAAVLVEIVQEKITPPEVELKVVIDLQSTAPDGVQKILAVFAKMGEQIAEKKYRAHIQYISAPKYRLDLFAADYKEAELAVQDLLTIGEKEAKKLSCHFAHEKKK